jgi:hypothetical protein
VLDGEARARERLATLQPFDEDVYRRLMETGHHAWASQRRSAAPRGAGLQAASDAGDAPRLITAYPTP